jgi:hypothetical protein
MLIRELFRMSGCVDEWKSMLKSNETLLQGNVPNKPFMSCAIVLVLEFLSVVCIIEEDDFDLVWEMVVQSLAQMPYDQRSNANKKRAKESGNNLSSTSQVQSWLPAQLRMDLCQRRQFKIDPSVTLPISNELRERLSFLVACL